MLKKTWFTEDENYFRFNLLQFFITTTFLSRENSKASLETNKN